jgi:hypothetical protein
MIFVIGAHAGQNNSRAERVPQQRRAGDFDLPQSGAANSHATDQQSRRRVGGGQRGQPMLDVCCLARKSEK